MVKNNGKNWEVFFDNFLKLIFGPSKNFGHFGHVRVPIKSSKAIRVVLALAPSQIGPDSILGPFGAPNSLVVARPCQVMAAGSDAIMRRRHHWRGRARGEEMGQRKPRVGHGRKGSERQAKGDCRLELNMR